MLMQNLGVTSKEYYGMQSGKNEGGLSCLSQFVTDNRRYSYSLTALGRETSQHDCEAKAGNFLAKNKQTLVSRG